MASTNETPRRRRIVPFAALLITSLATVACGEVQVEDPSLSLYEAKAIAQDGEPDIIALIPEDKIVAIDQRATGSLLSCTGERNFQWAGGTTVRVIDGADRAKIIENIANEFAQKQGWRLSDSSDVAGYPQFTIERTPTGGYLISRDKRPGIINIYSFSPCFHLPDDMSPHGGY